MYIQNNFTPFKLVYTIIEKRNNTHGMPFKIPKYLSIYFILPNFTGK